MYKMCLLGIRLGVGEHKVGLGSVFVVDTKPLVDGDLGRGTGSQQGKSVVLRVFSFGE